METVGQLKAYQYSHHGGAGRTRESKKLETYLKNNDRKLP